MNCYDSFGCSMNYPVFHHGTVFADVNIFLKSLLIARQSIEEINILNFKFIDFVLFEM